MFTKNLILNWILDKRQSPKMEIERESKKMYNFKVYFMRVNMVTEQIKKIKNTSDHLNEKI